MAINNQQNKFIEEVLKGKSYSDAYRTAYPRSKEWKSQTVASRAYQLRKKPEISKKIEKLRQIKKDEFEKNFIYDSLESKQITYNAMKMAYKDMQVNGIRTANTQLLLGTRKDLEDREEARRNREVYQSLEIKKRELQIAKLEAEINKLKGIAEEIEDMSEIEEEIYGVLDDKE
ncbi:MAG: hypothetical protein E7A85_00130 [Anaerococcus sp.]|nr:hypothetical protein [Anaerococcus sp.]